MSSNIEPSDSRSDSRGVDRFSSVDKSILCILKAGPLSYWTLTGAVRLAPRPLPAATTRAAALARHHQTTAVSLPFFSCLSRVVARVFDASQRRPDRH